MENMSSPNSLPSPASLIRSKTKLKSVSLSTKRTVAASKQDIAPSKNNNSIWDFPEDEGADSAAPMAKESKKPAPKPRAKKVSVAAEGQDLTEPPKKRGRPKKAIIDGVTEQAKEKVPRKPRATKTDTDGQKKIAIGRVTKSTSSTTKSKKSDQVSAYFASAPEDFLDIDEIAPHKDLNIEKAVDRRLDWTPPKAAAEVPRREENHAISTPDAESGPNGFGNLLTSFGYSKSESQSTDATSRFEPEPVRKRKLIELVKSSSVSSVPKPAAKVKAVRKKPKTITEQATRAYITLDEEPAEAAPILQYFSRDESAKAPNPRGSKTRPKPTKGRNGVMEAPELLAPEAAHEQARRQQFVFGTSSQLAREEDVGFLRDLQTAMQLSNQEDPFAEDLPPITRRSAHGTLASGEPKPSLWEAAARIEAEGANEMQVMDLTHSSQVENRIQEAKNAWHTEGAVSTSYVPTHDADDGWLSLEDTPMPPRVAERPRSPPPTAKASAIASKASVSTTNAEDSISTSYAPTPGADDGWLSLHDTPKPSRVSERPRSPTPSVRAPTRASRTIVPAQDTAPKAPETATVAPPPRVHSIVPKTVSSEPRCPDYESFSTTDLAKEIAKYKFKPVKKRDDMITLLKKCWEGKQKQTKGVLQTIPAEKAPPSDQPSQATTEVSVPSPKKPRGRPKKGEPMTASMRKIAEKTASAAGSSVDTASSALPASTSSPKRKRVTKKALPAIEEISDTDNPPARSPLRTQRTAPPLPLIASPPSSLDDLDDITLTPLSPTSAERELNSAITRAIKAEPRSSTSDPMDLSWQERIMLYDPIMLEDLTKWLNEEGLSSVKYDGEVQPAEVQKWCRAKSICCLSKESTRNGNRKGATKKIGK